MEYCVEAEEKFMAVQYLRFYVEADSPEEAAKRVEDLEVIPDKYGDIMPAYEGDSEITVIEVKPC